MNEKIHTTEIICLLIIGAALVWTIVVPILCGLLIKQILEEMDVI